MSDNARLRRARVVRIYDTRDTTVVLGSDGRAHQLKAESAELARELLSFLLEPRTRQEITEHVEALTGTKLPENGVVDQLIALLMQAGAVEAAQSAPIPAARWRGEHLVLCISGAVAAMHAPALVSQLLQRGFVVRVAASKNALRFISPFSLETLVHHPLAADLFEGESRVPHIDLATWADVVLVWPATATTLSRLATGDYDSLVSAIALATKAPVIVAPSMNAGMYSGAAVERNLAQLARDGMHVIHPAFGVEVADAPHDRTLDVGPAPPVGVIVQMLETALALHRKRAPRTAAQWDELYGSLAPAELPWHTSEPDADMLGALDRIVPEPCFVLDIGTGHGQLAVAAAERGHRVVAIDVSGRALAQASARAPAAAVLWLRDDVTHTRLQRKFELAFDRGCLHVLSADSAARYAQSLADLIAPGGHLLLKTHDAAEQDRHGTTPYTRDSLCALLGSAFEIVEEHASTFAGPAQTPTARLFVLRRSA